MQQNLLRKLSFRVPVPFFVFLSIFGSGLSTAETLETLDYKLRLETWVDGLNSPWALEFIDRETALVTEKSGALRMVRDGKLLQQPVAGTPAVVDSGQGGMLDVAIDPDYANNGWIYLAYSHGENSTSQSSQSRMTKVVRGRISDNTWSDEQTLFQADLADYLSTHHHYGSRIAFDNAGLMYFSIGERGKQEHAQLLDKPNGKIHRIYRDGSIPEDNPFVKTGIKYPSIYSYGNRNPQGLIWNAENAQLWSLEHGPRGGDELNLITAGVNYGWPEITYGINYNGTPVSDFVRKPDMAQPVLYWRPSIAVSSLEFYEGDLFPRWRGNLLVGSLRDQELRLLTMDGQRVMHQEVLLKNRGRIRDLKVDSAGAIYLVLNSPDEIVRITPD